MVEAKLRLTEALGCRMRLRRQNIETQQLLVAASEGDWTPDDALRFQSFLFAFFRGLDKVLSFIPQPSILGECNLR